MKNSSLGALQGLIWILIATPSVLLAILLMISTVTLSGWLVALGVLALCVFPGFAFSTRRWAGLTAPILALLGIALLGAAWMRAPSGTNPPQAALQSVYTGSAGFNRMSPAQLVPEIDQHLMGSHVFAFADPYIDYEQGQRIRQVIRAVYEPMNRDPEFRNLGCALGQCYTELFGGDAPTGHAYVYRPAGIDGQQLLPAIVFLHGSLGNFKGYLWCWKNFADRNGFAIVAPSFGIGDWSQTAGMDAVDHALEICENLPGVDQNRLYISGVSNGGMGVTRALHRHPDKFLGAICISPVLEVRLAAEAFRDRSVLVVSGTNDRRIPSKGLKMIVSEALSGGADVELDLVAGEDHFLLFSQPERVWRSLEAWLSAHPAPRTE